MGDRDPIRHVRVLTPEGPRWGLHEGDAIAVMDAPPWLDAQPVRRCPVGEAELIAPVAPSKIVCVGLNYRAHAQEMGKPLPPEPLIFLKPSTTVVAPGGAVRLPPTSERVEHEAELACVVGRTLTRATAAQCSGAILGLTCANDVTARDIQRKEQAYTRAKGFDTFFPVGPWIVSGLSADDLGIELRVNGELRQRGRTSDMIFPLAEVLAFISQVMTLLPGDVVSTGTPPGVGPLLDGDEVSIEIEGVGALRHRVAR